MPDDLRKLTAKERDGLAIAALTASEKSRRRATKYRAKKKADGMTQISIWVPVSRAKHFKAAFEKHVRDALNEGEPSV